MKKVMLVFGTRPEAIKMCPLVKEFQKYPTEFETIVCVTGQHREMLDQVLNIFDVTPDYDLNIMKQGQDLYDVTARVLVGMRDILKEVHPDIVLVHGDTTTSTASALAAFYQQIPVGHVEAGLRTDNKYSPFPEEMNRQMIDCMTDLFFAPTELSRQNLLRQNIPTEKIYVTGNTAIDAMSTTVCRDYRHEVLDWVGDSRLLLLTAHRRENLGEPMKQIFTGIRRALEEVRDVKAVYPMHMNPRVREIATDVFSGCENVRLMEPLEVSDFHNFQSRAHLILTDSGGIQEEAPSLGKPVLVLRDNTERPEGISAGTLRLAGTKAESVYSATVKLLTDTAEYEKMSHAVNPYGDGHASERIADAIVNHFS